MQSVCLSAEDCCCLILISPGMTHRWERSGEAEGWGETWDSMHDERVHCIGTFSRRVYLVVSTRIEVRFTIESINVNDSVPLPTIDLASSH